MECPRRLYPSPRMFRYSAKTWGEPLLLGPGSIHVAHTSEERISKRELSDAVEMYANVVKKLMAKA